MRALSSLLVVVLAACASGGVPSPSGTPQLDGSWQLSFGSMDGERLRTLPDHPVTLTIEGSEIGGTSACNSYGGRLALVDGRVDIVELGVTAMGCAEDVMAVEADYVASLDRVSAIRREGDELVLAGPQLELRFQALPPAPTADLVDSIWVLETLFAGDVASSVQGERATLELRSDGTFSGSTGCRTFDGRWLEQGNQIIAPEMGMNDAECPAALFEQDSHVVSVIGDGFAPTIEGDLLTLLDPGGVGLVYRLSR